MSGAHRVPRDERTLDLVREAIEETRELVRAEAALARHDAARDLGLARAAVLKLSIGASGCVAGVTLLLVAVAAAFAPLWLASLVVGGLVLAVSVAVGFAGWRAFPRRPLAPTAARVKTELEELRRPIRGQRS
jgi:hypothetical protein